MSTPEDSQQHRQELRRSWFRGYRAGDVELLIARTRLAADQLEDEFVAGRARQALHTEVAELQGRLDALRDEEDRRNDLERQARSRGDQIIAAAEQQAAALHTSGLREVAELQRPLEQLLALRAGLTQSLSRVLEDIGTTLQRVASAPATELDAPPPQREMEAAPPPPPEQHEPEPAATEAEAEAREAPDLEDQLARWTQEQQEDDADF